MNQPGVALESKSLSVNTLKCSRSASKYTKSATVDVLSSARRGCRRPPVYRSLVLAHFLLVFVPIIGGGRHFVVGLFKPQFRVTMYSRITFKRRVNTGTGRVRYSQPKIFLSASEGVYTGWDYSTYRRVIFGFDLFSVSMITSRNHGTGG